MQRVAGSTAAVLSLGVVVAGCQTAPARYAGEGANATYHAAAMGAGAVRTTGADLYTGAGRAVRQPFHDLNMMQDKIAPVLLRAEDRPYDLAGVDSCSDVLNRVAELDLALGPDVDTPKERKKRTRRGADFAAGAALDAAGSAAEHFIPMRSTIKQLSGATRYENHVKHAVLAGETRRSFLKAIGMSHDCSWPAAPLDFKPTRVADADARWSLGTSGSAGPVLLASTTAPTAQASAAPHTVQPVAIASAVAGDVSARAVPAQPRIVIVSAATSPRPGSPVFIPVREQLAMPSAQPSEPTMAQSWRPAPVLAARSEARVVQVAAPVTTTAALTSSTGASAAPAPWSASTSAFAAAARP